MSDINASGVQMTVGLEVGDKHIHACFLDHHGHMVRRGGPLVDRRRQRSPSAKRADAGPTLSTSETPTARRGRPPREGGQR